MKSRILLLGLLVISLAFAAVAQSNRATITGTVKDQSGAVLADALVTATNVATNVTSTNKTGGDGLYTIVNLPAGTYKLSVAKAGFKGFELKDLTLEVSQVVAMNVVLSVGATSETVEVTGSVPILQTENAELSTNLNNQAVTDLPLNVSGGRTLSKFMFAYVPGVEGDDYNSHINGSVALSKEVMIDGTSAVAQLGGYLNESQPPMESIQEFQVSTGGLSADEGRTGGGVFRYEMKSGTNQWHGSLFGFLHDPSLNALSAANKLAMQRDPSQADVYSRKSDSLSDWGGSVGGPIVKDKLFFYTAYERYMASNWNLGPLSGTVPTDAMMGLNPDGTWAQYADLSIIPVPIYNPQTGAAFVNNQIPTTMISSTTKQILQLYHQYYKPQSDLPLNNAKASNLPWNHINEFSVKVDYNISDKNHLFGSYIYNLYPRILADQGGIWSPNSPNGGPLANSYQHNTTAPSARLGNTYTFTPNVINSFRFTLNRFYNPSIAKSQSGNWDQTLGLGAGAGNFPLIGFDYGWYGGGYVPSNGWNMSSIGSQFNDFYAANTFIYNDDVSWVKGRHTFKFGAEFRAMQFNSHPDQGTFNSIVFDPIQTASPTWWAQPWGSSGSAYASFLMGTALRATRMEADPNYGRRKTLSLYASDSFKVTSKFTLNMDLRWDYNSPYKEKYGHWSSFVLDKINPVTGLPGTMEYLTNGDQSFNTRQYWFNFAPHIGGAYQLAQKTVIRGSFSVFYVPLNMNTWGGVPYQQTGNPGFHYNNATGAFNWDNGYPGVPSVSQAPDYTQWGAVSIDPRGLMPGNTQQYSIGVQQELMKDMKLDVNYIQNNGYHLQSGFLLTNQPTVANMQHYVATGQFPSTYNGYYDNCMWVTYSCPTYVGLVPYPQAAVGYGPIFSVGSPLGNSDYKALQFSVSKRASHGLSFLGSYVYSRAHGDVDSSMQELWWTGSLQNIYDLQSERKGIASFDMTHIVKGYVTYELPFGQGKQLFSGAGSTTNKFIGGWSLNFAFHYNTGTPISVHSTNSVGGWNTFYVNLASGCNLTQGSYSLNQQYLNPNCYQNPTLGQLGNGGNFIGAVRNPGLATEDLGLIKSVGFGPGERYQLSLRLEFYNLFNRSQLAGPNTNLGDPNNFGYIQNYTGFGGRVGQFGARFTF